MFSGIDQVDSSLIVCINMADCTLQHKNRNRRGDPARNSRRQTPSLNGLDRLSQGNLGIPHQSLSTSGLLNQPTSLILYSIRTLTSSWKVTTTSNHMMTSRIGQTTSTCSWMPCHTHHTWPTSSGRKPSSRSKKKLPKPQKSLASRFSTSHGLKSQKD